MHGNGAYGRRTPPSNETISHACGGPGRDRTAHPTTTMAVVERPFEAPSLKWYFEGSGDRQYPEPDFDKWREDLIAGYPETA